jgi:glycosyltransferase involved in cell wall biosynthesis
MHILHITTQTSWRGGENQIRYLIQGLKHHPRIGLQHVALQPNTNIATKFKGVAPVHEVRMRNDVDLFAALKIAKYCLTHGINMIHTHSGRAHSLGIFTKKIMRYVLKQKTNASKPDQLTQVPKLIVHRRVEHKKKLSTMDRWKYLNDEVDAYICVSSAVARAMLQSGVPATKIHIAPSAVDASPYTDKDLMRAKARESLNIEQDTLVFTFTGAIEESKGVLDLLRAWSILLKHPIVHQQKVQLLIAGEGPLLKELQANAGDSQWQHSVSYLGFRNDIPDILCASDVLVLPSHAEGLGTVLLEGGLAGCALIGTKVGGIPDIIQNDTTGKLVQAHSPQELAQAMIEMASSETTRAQLSQNVQKTIATNFSLEAMVSKNLEVYLRLSSR